MNARYLLCLLLLAGVGCGSSSPDDDGTTMPGSDGGTTLPDTDSGTTSPGGDGGGTTSPGSDGGGTSPGTPGEFTCTTATLFSGHPQHDADPGVHANDGDPLAGVVGRPLLWREVIFVGSHIVTVTGQEVWASDLSASSPVLRRIAGRYEPGQALLDGPCDDARFANLQDLAADADGSLYVMDQTGNAILKITDPFGASCTVHFWAGTSVDTYGITPPAPPNVGYVDGPGLSAKFALPGRITIDDAGVIYVWDENNAKIRTIAPDAEHTVATLAPVVSRDQDVIVDSMVIMRGVLYLYAHDTAGEVFIQAVDVETGDTEEIIRGRSSLFGFNGALQVGGMATDGIDLFVYFKGGIFRVTTRGEITHIAGDVNIRSTIEFETGYDPSVPHSAMEVQLANRPQYSTAGADSWLGIDADDNLYFVGSVQDPYVVRLECGR